MDGLPSMSQLVYLRGMRRSMNYDTGMVNTSYSRLSQVVECHVRTTKPEPRLGKEGLRAVFKQLEKAGLITWIKGAQKGLLFSLDLADVNSSVQNKDNPKTTPRQPQEDNPRKTSHSNESQPQDNPKTTPRQPQEDNPLQGTGNRGKKKVSKDTQEKLNFDEWPKDPSPEAWNAIMGFRKKKRATNTQRALDLLGKQLFRCLAAGYSFDDCMATWEERQWAAIKLEWLLEDHQPHGKSMSAASSNKVPSWAKSRESIDGECTRVDE